MGLHGKKFCYVSIMALVTVKLLFFAACEPPPQLIGVNYGTLGGNLPAPPDVINLFKKNKINLIRIYDPNPDILNALRGSTDIAVSLGVKNEDIPNIASSPEVATAWVNANVMPYKDNITIGIVTVGNEVIPGPFATHVAQAMANIRSSLLAVNLFGIRVTTTTAFNLQTSFPPSTGSFAPDVAQIMKDVTNVLRNNSAYLLASFYPYFAYASNPNDISLDYALFNAQTPVVVDGQFQYSNLLEAQIDAYNAALAKIGAGDIPVLVAETGWPTAGNEPFTSIANAQTYNTNLIKRVKTGKGTPRKPDLPILAFIFATFDEDQKPAGIEQHWGIFSPNMEPKYPLEF